MGKQEQKQEKQQKEQEEEGGQRGGAARRRCVLLRLALALWPWPALSPRGCLRSLARNLLISNARLRLPLRGKGAAPTPEHSLAYRRPTGGGR